MEGIDVVALVSRWIHLGAAFVTIGGAAFMLLALNPAAKEALSEEDRANLRDQVRRRWAKFVHAGIGLLLLTGFFNFYWLVIRVEVPSIPYHALFGPKLLAAMLVFFVASILAGSSPAFAKWRAAPNKGLTIIVVLAGMIILVSGLLMQIRVAYLVNG